MLRVEWEVEKGGGNEECWATGGSSIISICPVDPISFWEVTKMTKFPKPLLADCIPWEADWDRGECVRHLWVSALGDMDGKAGKQAWAKGRIEQWGNSKEVFSQPHGELELGQLCISPTWGQEDQDLTSTAKESLDQAFLGRKCYLGWGSILQSRRPTKAAHSWGPSSCSNPSSGGHMAFLPEGESSGTPHGGIQNRLLHRVVVKMKWLNLWISLRTVPGTQ